MKGRKKIVPTVDELIENGYIVKKACIKDGYGGKYISGEDYQKWLMICKDIYSICTQMTLKLNISPK